MNRRAFLSVAASTPLVVGPSFVLAPALVAASSTPSEIDLRRYHGFLWEEFQRLGDRLGVGTHDSHTIWKDPAVAGQIISHLEATPPEGRAVRVLTAAGL